MYNHCVGRKATYQERHHLPHSLLFSRMSVYPFLLFSAMCSYSWIYSLTQYYGQKTWELILPTIHTYVYHGRLHFISKQKSTCLHDFYDKPEKGHYPYVSYSSLVRLSWSWNPISNNVAHYFIPQCNPRQVLEIWPPICTRFHNCEIWKQLRSSHSFHQRRHFPFTVELWTTVVNYFLILTYKEPVNTHKGKCGPGGEPINTKTGSYQISLVLHSI